MQRVRVGVTGLALVVILIGLASAIFSVVNRERPVAAAGGARPEVVAAIADSNASGPADEPLAELGVAPAAPDDNSAAPKGR